MKLTEIQIDCPGVWRNLRLPVPPDGLSVFYGPNEAGKTTLRQFIAGMLFGFWDEEAIGQIATGALQVEDADGTHSLHRPASGDDVPTAGRHVKWVERGAHAISVPLDGIDRKVFERIFTTGLGGLSELDSQSGADVARHLYGATPGPTGTRLLEASRRVAERRQVLIDPLQQQGELVALFERHDQLTARLHEIAQLQTRHTEWAQRREQLEREIADLRKRLAGTGEQLRGHEFLQSVWGPWDRIRDCRHELDELPEIADFPERGLERLEKLEGEIAEAAEIRDRLLADVRHLHDEAIQSPATEWRAHAAAVRGFVEQRGWLVELHRRRQALQQHKDDCDRDFAAACGQLGAGWPAERIETADVSAAGQRRLAGTAASFQAALSRRKAFKRNCRRLADARRDLKESLAESLHDLGGGSIDDALARSREQIAAVNRTAGLKLREVELTERLETLAQHRHRIIPQLRLPKWVYFVLGVFAFMGVLLAGWGLVAGLAVSAIAGAIYAMLGITCGGLAWGLKIQYEGDAAARLKEIESASLAATSELHALRESISQAVGEGERRGDPSALICQAQARIGELLEMAAHQRKLRGMHSKLAACRKKLATARREVATANQNWNDLLRGIGLPEALSIDETLAAWQLLSVAAERQAACKAAEREWQAVSLIWNSYRNRIADLERRLSPEGDETGDLLDVLASWEDQLLVLERGREDRREMRLRLRQKRREAREYDKRVEAIKVQRNALLVLGGAANRDEFEERSRLFARRTYLEDQLHDAQADLDAACAGHGDLALVEEDLERFEPRQNSECIEMLRLELADLENDLARAFEQFAGIQREIEALENDTQATKVRFELRQVEDGLRRLARDWAVCETAARTIDDLRRDFERTCQSPALAEAARFFARITCQKHRNIWAPLGERRLIVEDDRGRSFPMQSLSRGTREQLLLAMRLAIVRELGRQGVSLPLVLDDVIASFDEERASATVALLLELAGQGQQMLFFTCHKHLAQLFARQGTEPVWLPNHSDSAPEHDEQRLAG
jgi:uncharacterized protein YhaN